MKFNNFNYKSHSGKDLINGELSIGVYQYFGNFDFINALAGRKKFKGTIIVDKPYKYREYKNALNNNKLVILALHPITDTLNGIGPWELLNNYIDYYGLDEEKTKMEFNSLKNEFDLPEVNDYNSLSNGQKDLYAIITSLAIHPNILIIINSLESISHENVSKLKRVMNSFSNTLIVFTSGTDYTDENISFLKIKDGSITYANKTKGELKLNNYSKTNSLKKSKTKTLAFILLIHYLLSAIIIFVCHLINNNLSEDLKKFNATYSSQLFKKEEIIDIKQKPNYFETPVSFINMKSSTVELRYDTILMDEEIKELNLNNNEVSITLGLIQNIGSKSIVTNWLESLSLSLKEVFDSKEEAIFLNPKTFDDFKNKYLDYDGNLYRHLDNTYLNDTGLPLDPEVKNTYYLPLNKVIDTSIVESKSINFGGYYIPHDNIDCILLSKDVEKNYWYKNSIIYNYRYLSTDIMSIPDDIIDSDIKVSYSKKCSFMLTLNILEIIGITFILSSFTFISLKKSKKIIDSSIKNYSFFNLSLKDILKLDQINICTFLTLEIFILTSMFALNYILKAITTLIIFTILIITRYILLFKNTNKKFLL